MAVFTFRLEQVRVYRKQLEEQAMQALAQAVVERDALKKRITDLEAAVGEQRNRLFQVAGLDAGERWLIQGYKAGLKQDLAQAVESLAGAEERVDKCRVELVQRAKDRGLLDSLKEKQAARHVLAERQKEQQTNDETATLRYKPAAV